MNLYKCKTYVEDLKFTVNNTECIKKLNNTSIFITGATGLICSSLIDLLIIYNEYYNGKITIWAAGRDEKRLKERFFPYSERKYFHFVQYDASKKNVLDFSCDYIIHGASNAYPQVIQKYPIDTMLDNFQGTYELLNYAEKIRSKRFLFISSSEVYGKKDNVEPFKEDEYGSIDILNPRSSYSSSKRAAETLCASYAYEKNMDIIIIRPGHIFGPTANVKDNRVSSAFAFEAAKGKNLVLKSKGKQIRSYCYMLDAASAILTSLLMGEKGNAYNISNPSSIMSIRELAEFYAKVGGVNVLFDVPNQIEEAAFNPMDNSSLNGYKLEKIGWKGLFNAKKATEHTVEIIKECLSK